jgi:hypothetical protein
MDRNLAHELDTLLKYLNGVKMNKAYNDYELSYTAKGKADRFKLLYDILITDGKIDEKTNIVTADGRRFIAMGGYSDKARKEFRRQIWEVVVIGATVVNSLVILYLTYLSIKC